MAQDWNLKGTYFEACNCDLACPCVFLSSPTTGECTVLIGWHIDEGSFDGVSLNNLNVAMAAHAPGHMMEVEWKAALYLDASASEEQAGALGKIFSGQSGGHFARIGAHIGEVLGVASVPIDYQAEKGNRRIKIGDIGEAEIESAGGQGGEDITVTNHPLCVSPGFPAVVSKSKTLKYNDHGYKWDISEKTGFFSPFNYVSG
jgi:hypothetical protein